VRALLTPGHGDARVGRVTDPPLDVRIEIDGGGVIPVQCRYVGDERGIAIWEVVDVPSVAIVSIRIGTLPARTAIRIVPEISR